MMRKCLRAVAFLLCATTLAGCGVTSGDLRLENLFAKDAGKRDGVLSANATHVEKGQRHYRDGAFGLAEKNFRAAVEEKPANAEAWIGLAASYDRLRRFRSLPLVYNICCLKTIEIR